MPATYLILIVLTSLIGCAHSQPPAVSKSVTEPVLDASPTTAAVKTEAPPKASVEPAPPTPPVSAVTLPAKAIPPALPREQHWTLKNGKLTGPGNLTSGKFLSKFVNPKTSAVTIDTCWNYGDFAVIESKTKGEMVRVK